MEDKNLCLSFLAPMTNLSQTFLNIIEKIENEECSIDSSFPEKLFNKTPKEDVLNAIETLIDYNNLFLIDFDEYSKKVKTLSDFVGNCNNTILFRNFRTDKGREVCYINKQIPDIYSDRIKEIHSNIRSLIGRLTPRLNLIKNQNSTDSYVDINYDQMAIKSDISSFFRSVRFENVIKYLSKTFLVKNILMYSKSQTENKELRVFERIEIALWGFIGCLFHNGIIPTGARYANDLAACYLNNLVFNTFRKDMLYSNRARIYVYVDDLLFLGEEGNVKEFYAEFEKAINKGGLYLNYKKTQYFYPKNGILEYSSLGRTRKFDFTTGFVSKVDSKARKKCLDIIKERREYDASEKGIINYALYMRHGANKIVNPDILMHSYFNDKSELWDKLIAGELNLKLNKSIFDPTNLKYKDICIMSKDIDVGFLSAHQFLDITDAIAEFVKLFILDNPFGLNLYGINLTESNEGNYNLILNLVRQRSRGTANIIPCPLIFRKDFLNGLYVEGKDESALNGWI